MSVGQSWGALKGARISVLAGHAGEAVEAGLGGLAGGGLAQAIEALAVGRGGGAVGEEDGLLQHAPVDRGVVWLDIAAPSAEEAETLRSTYGLEFGPIEAAQNMEASARRPTRPRARTRETFSSRSMRPTSSTAPTCSKVCTAS